VERAKGIEPSALAWEARVLPLYDAREGRYCTPLVIRTFGCQMNEYDSDKMADVLGAHERTGQDRQPGRGRRDPLQHLFGAREGAGKGVPRSRPRALLKQKNPDLIIGVGGCVASQEGEAIVKRAPYVDVVFGPQTLHRLPNLIAARKRERARRWTSPSPRSRSSTTCRRRASRARAPSCRSWKAVQQVLHLLHRALHPRRRISRPLADVLAESPGWRHRASRK
jgi:tRNA-2-methylthio-N6-dimethylallyladenosine synthase